MAIHETDFKWKERSDLFSPLDLVTLARPGTGVANAAGDLLIVPVSKYDAEKKENKQSISIASVESKAIPAEVAFAKGGEAFWLDDRTLAHVVPEGDGKTQQVYTISVQFETESLSTPDPPTLIGTFPAGAGATNFRYKASVDQLVFSSYVYPDGTLETVKEQDDKWANRGTSAYVYEATYERHWDTWRGPKDSTLFTVGLKKGSDGKYALGDKFTNVLNGTKHQVPVEPFGGLDNFDVSETHIVYTTKDPNLPQGWHTRQNIYVVDINGKESPRELTTGEQGATNSPVFAKAGDKVAWVEMDKDGSEADRAKIVIYDLKKDVRFRITQNWDRSVSAVGFSPDDAFIYFIAGDNAREKLWALPVPETPSASINDDPAPALTPLALISEHAVSNFQVLPNDRILYTSSSISSPNDVFVLRGVGGRLFASTEAAAAAQGHVHGQAMRGSESEQLTTFTADTLKGKGLDAGIEEFHFEGAEGARVHGWALKPKGWEAGQKKKYPVLFLIHGGPQGAWEDSWSNRWNPAIFAQQGYFTLAINPTGSTSFGQEFTDAISGDWGGRPFEDLRKGWKHALEAYPEIDADRAVAAGASWGGYAINWIQVHPEWNFNFKALVCHDGVFDPIYNGFSTEELYFFNHEWNGRPWENATKALAEKYSPANHIQKASTPQLLIHGSQDFRLAETESIGAFHALLQLGVPSRLVIFPDENHWVLKHQNSLKWHYEVLRWFDLYVGEGKQ